jgi:ribosome biogenesis protein NSA1
MVSAALDRYVRFHSVVPPPERSGSHQDRKGRVLEKAYLNSVPTVVVWDRCLSDGPSVGSHEQEDEVWDNMEHVS